MQSKIVWGFIKYITLEIILSLLLLSYPILANEGSQIEELEIKVQILSQDLENLIDQVWHLEIEVDRFKTLYQDLEEKLEEIE